MGHGPGALGSFARFVRRAALVALVALLSRAPCVAQTAPEAPAPTNLICPVMTDQDIDPEIWVEHEGKRVYFCCQKCRRLFNADPAKYAASLAQILNAAQEGAGGGAEPVLGAAEPAKNAGALPPPTGPTISALPDKPKRVDFLERLGRFHIVSVHFPIALLALAAALDAFRPRGPGAAGPASTVRLLTWFGALAALASMGLGLLHEGSVEARLATLPADANLLDWHKWVGVGATVWAAICVVLVERRERRRADPRMDWLATGALVVGAIGVGAAAHFGGQLVWGRDFLFSW